MKIRSICDVALCICLTGGFAAAQGRSPGGQMPGGGPGNHAPGGPGGPAGSPGGSPGGPGAGNVAPPPNSGSPGTSGQPHGAPRFGPVGRWWDDKSVVRAVGLSNDQQKKMDAIFRANKPAILEAYKTFLAEQAKLDTLSKQPQVDKSRVFSAIDSVSQAKASLEKANTLMLLQIRQQLEPSQINKLDNLK